MLCHGLDLQILPIAPMPLSRILVPLLAVVAPLLSSAAPVRDGPAGAELISEFEALQRGSTQWVALLLSPDHGWHTYWRNPGDSGLATKIEWQLPDGITAGDMQWPYPQTEELGDLTNYGYADATMHLVPLQIAADFPDQEITLRATANWLTCKDVCIPGMADLELPMAITDQRPSAGPWAPEFATARARLPQATDWPAQFSLAAEELQLLITAPADQVPAGAQLQFFAYAKNLVEHSASPRWRQDGERWLLQQPLSPYFTTAPPSVDGVLVVTTEGRETAYELTASPAAAALAQSNPPAPLTSAPAAPAPSWWLALGLALLGGLILNLMPCVFPILSLKALSLVAQDQPGHRRRDALAYTAGVVISCLLVAAALLALRAAGSQIGWGFQLQSPLFVALLAYLMFTLGLALSGAVNLGAGWMAMGDSLTRRSGPSGSFFTGVLAVVVASPCTAPFMGVALGYAVTQPPTQALGIFAALGLGLASPFLLLAAAPSLGRWLPRPGAWMETFKQAMAFPLYLTAVWLLWVLSRQTDPQMLARVLVGMVLIAFALWLTGRENLPARAFRLAALVAAVALPLGAATPRHATAEIPVNTAPAAALPVEAWSSQRVEEHLAQGRSVFVNFTADWCLSCKFNESSTLSRPAVAQAFAQHNVAYLRGDWTLSDPAITAELARHGRNGVPLYLLLHPDQATRVLPQILTPDIVIEALAAKES